MLEGLLCRCLLPKERLASKGVQVLAVPHRLTLTVTPVTDFTVSLSHDLLTVSFGIFHRSERRAKGSCGADQVKREKASA